MKAMHVVEAALFSAGRALSVEEIAERTDLPVKEIEGAAKRLQALYAERDTVLEVGKAGAKWGMQVRTQAAEPAAKFARMEIAPKLLKTLALIAYHQPMRQSELADMIGSKVYDHVPELKEMGLVRTRQDGATKILSTTPRFPEYFGLDAATPEQIRQVLGKLVGLETPTRRKEKKEIESFAPEQGGRGVEGDGDARKADREETSEDTPEAEAAATPEATGPPDDPGTPPTDEGARPAKHADAPPMAPPTPGDTRDPDEAEPDRRLASLASAMVED